MKWTLLALMFLSSTPLFSASKIIIGIAGGSGSGKSTLAYNIQKAFPEKSVLLCQDSYYKDLSNLTVEERGPVNFDHPDSLDFSMLREHILSMKEGNSIAQPIYNFRTHSREVDTKEIASAEIIVVEGILLFSVKEIRDLFDIKFFVDTDEDVRLLRRIERDMTERARSFQSVRDQYLSTVKPMHALFVEPSKKHADMIIPHGGHNMPALALIITKLQEILSESAPDCESADSIKQ